MFKTLSQYLRLTDNKLFHISSLRIKTVMFFQNYRILVVDDLQDNLFLLQTVLEAEGYDVDTASDGVTAIAKVKNSPPDLMLLDVMMPDMSGFEVAQQIRQHKDLPFIPILLVTAHDESSRVEGLNAGANDFIRKPIEFDELLARVRAFCS
jgi:DNA-binding response OmpR family regulator